jgi:hypothetical protein
VITLPFTFIISITTIILVVRGRHHHHHHYRSVYAVISFVAYLLIYMFIESIFLFHLYFVDCIFYLWVCLLIFVPPCQVRSLSITPWRGLGISNGEGHQVWRVTTLIFNKQSRRADMEWSFNIRAVTTRRPKMLSVIIFCSDPWIGPIPRTVSGEGIWY